MQSVIVVYFSCLSATVFIKCGCNYEVWRMRPTVKGKFISSYEKDRGCGKRKNGIIIEQVMFKSNQWLQFTFPGSG